MSNKNERGLQRECAGEENNRKKDMSNGGMRDGTDVRRVARQTGKEREVDICLFNSASF